MPTLDQRFMRRWEGMLILIILKVALLVWYKVYIHLGIIAWYHLQFKPSLRVFFYYLRSFGSENFTTLILLPIHGNFLYPVRVRNCDSNSRLVVDEQEYDQCMLEMAKSTGL